MNAISSLAMSATLNNVVAVVTPPPGPTAFVWYDLADATTRLNASGSSVTTNGSQIFQIRDKSGNGFHATNKGGLSAGAANRNILYSTYPYGPVLDTSGITNAGSNNGAANTQTNTGFTTAVGAGTPVFTNGIIAFVVAAPVGSGGNGSLGCIFTKKGSGNVPFPIEFYNDGRWRGNGSSFVGLTANYNANNNVCSTPVTTTNTGVAPSLKTPTLFTGIWGAPNAATYYEYINGSSSFTGAWSAPAWTDNNTNLLTLSTRADNITWSFNYISELLLYNTATLTDAFRQKVEGYLAWKWGMQSMLPTGHLYKTAGPTNFNPSLGA